MNNEIKVVTGLVAMLFCFILVLVITSSLTKDSCVENIKDKPAVEIKLICG